MSTKYQDIYRISSTRLQNWDYTWNAIYSVTINTHGQEDFFGEILKGMMKMSNLGAIANVLWCEIKNHFPFVDIDAFVVMPNHVHGIITINNTENIVLKKETENALFIQPSSNDETANEDSCGGVKTRHVLSQIKSENSPGDKRFQNQGKNSLSSIISSYKSAVSKHVHRMGYRFDWQSRFYDRIICDEEALLKARKYVDNNVANWKGDPFHSKVS